MAGGKILRGYGLIKRDALRELMVRSFISLNCEIQEMRSKIEEMGDQLQFKRDLCKTIQKKIKHKSSMIAIFTDQLDKFKNDKDEDI